MNNSLIPDLAIDFIAKFYSQMVFGETPSQRAYHFDQWADQYWTRFARNLDVDFQALSLKLPF
jgi:hypothetical protein